MEKKSEKTLTSSVLVISINFFKNAYKHTKIEKSVCLCLLFVKEEWSWQEMLHEGKRSIL